MAAELGVTVQQASYTATCYILAAGVAPMFVVPIANVYGRRPLYLVGGFPMMRM